MNSFWNLEGVSTHYSLCLEPFHIYGEGEYNINGVTEISVTDSFMGLDPEVRQCEIYADDTYNKCVREHHRNEILEKCKCLPFSVFTQSDFDNKVMICIENNILICWYIFNPN